MHRLLVLDYAAGLTVFRVAPDYRVVMTYSRCDGGVMTC